MFGAGEDRKSVGRVESCESGIVGRVTEARERLFGKGQGKWW